MADIQILDYQQFLHSSLEVLHTRYVFEAEKEAQAHLQACMWHLRPTETLTAIGYCSISYLSVMTPCLAILLWDERAGLVTPAKRQWSK